MYQCLLSEWFFFSTIPMACLLKVLIQITSKRSQPHSMSTDVQGSIVCQHVKPTVLTQCAAQTPHHTQNIGTLASHLVILKQQSLLSTILPRPTQTLQFNSNGTACACISSGSSRLCLVPPDPRSNTPFLNPPHRPTYAQQASRDKPRGNTAECAFQLAHIDKLWWQTHLLRCFSVFGGNSFQFQIYGKTETGVTEIITG